MTLTPRITNESLRKPDRVAGALASGFVVLLLATELILTLPDEADSPVFVAAFYAAHRSFIVSLQVLGFVAAAFLGAYAWRLRSIDRVVAVAGMIMAVCALVPGLITLMIAIVADPDHPAAAGVWNALEPRGDDILLSASCCSPEPSRYGWADDCQYLASWQGSWPCPVWLASCWRRPGGAAVRWRPSARCSS